MSSQEQENTVPDLSFKRVILSLKGGKKSGLTKEFAKPLIADFGEGEESAKTAAKPKTFKTGQMALLKARVTLEAAKPAGSRREFELLRLKHRLPANDPHHIDDDELDLLMKEQLHAASQRWEHQKENRTFNQVEYNNTRQQIYSLTVAQPPDRRINWIHFAHSTGIINEVEFDLALAKAMHDAREKWIHEDKLRNSNPEERKRARKLMQQILSSIGDERSKAIIEKSKS